MVGVPIFILILMLCVSPIWAAEMEPLVESVAAHVATNASVKAPTRPLKPSSGCMHGFSGVEGSRQARKTPTKLLCRFSGTRADWTTRLRQSRFVGFRPGKGVPLERWVAMEIERPLPVALLYTVWS